MDPHPHSKALGRARPPTHLQVVVSWRLLGQQLPVQGGVLSPQVDGPPQPAVAGCDDGWGQAAEGLGHVLSSHTHAWSGLRKGGRPGPQLPNFSFPAQELLLIVQLMLWRDRRPQTKARSCKHAQAPSPRPLEGHRGHQTSSRNLTAGCSRSPHRPCPRC